MWSFPLFKEFLFSFKTGSMKAIKTNNKRAVYLTVAAKGVDVRRK